MAECGGQRPVLWSWVFPSIWAGFEQHAPFPAVAVSSWTHVCISFGFVSIGEITEPLEML